ncbi:hypothetical protein Nepgr_017672 [Nepenthes gracilis]|uniref:LisH domain-containing protein n=1 Tax=Nepenthes gracilis TaxID=150966 RepID=A0AAD3ST28_NEPGR|nr:hypothetical protein Nepgr_017672 [Nepenthes gracilis]
MGSNDGWDAQKSFNIYLHDYLVKRNMHKTAEIFAQEANVPVHPIVIDSPEGFLSEWWMIFSDVYFCPMTNHFATTENAFGSIMMVPPPPPPPQQSVTTHYTGLAASIKGKQIMGAVTQNQHSQMPEFELNQKYPGQFPLVSNFGGMWGQQEAPMSAAKIIHNHPPRQLFKHTPLHQGLSYVNLGSTAQGLPLYGLSKEILLPTHEAHVTMIDNVVSTTPLNGLPLIGADQIPLSLKPPIPQGHHELLSQLQACIPGRAIFSPLGSSSTLDTRNMMLSRNNLDDGKDCGLIKAAIEDDFFKSFLVPADDHVDSFGTSSSNKVVYKGRIVDSMITWLPRVESRKTKLNRS